MNANEIANSGIVTQLAVVHTMLPKVKELIDSLQNDAVRYKWLRSEFAAGRETYLAEGMPSEESLDKYIDEQLKKAQEK